MFTSIQLIQLIVHQLRRSSASFRSCLLCLYKESRASNFLLAPSTEALSFSISCSAFFFSSSFSYFSFGEGDGDDKGIVSRMIEAIENRKVEQERADTLIRNQNKGGNRENLGVSVRCFEIYGRANAKGVTSDYNVYDLIHNKETFIHNKNSDDKKPSASSTLYRYKKNIGMNKYYPKNIDLKKLNKVWYEADDISKDNFTLVKQGSHFKELSTTFIKQKLVVTSSGEENIELATYMQNLLKDYRRVYPTKYNKDSSRGHCIFQITLNHHGKRNEIYIGDLAGVEDVSGSGSGENREKSVLQEGQAIKDSVSSFIESFKQKQSSTCFDGDKNLKPSPLCNLKGPIEFLTKELFTDKDAKLMIAACFDPATTNGSVQQNPQNDIKRKIMQLNASVLTSLFKE
jgi:hypothetical protein